MKRVKKENKEKIMEMIRKAGSEEYETSWNKAGVFSTSKKKSNVKKGRLSRAQGARFELKVRGELESKEWVMDKWTNNVDLSSKDDSGEPSEGKLVKAKRKYNPYKKMLIVGTGFPDFIAFKKTDKKNYEVIGVEVKMNGILSKIEKEKCAWYLKNEIFSRILIAKKEAPKGVPSSTKKKGISEKGKKRGQIEYVDFVERYGKKLLH